MKYLIKSENTLFIKENGALENLQKEFDEIMIWGTSLKNLSKTEEEKYIDTLKYAIIDNKDLCYRSNLDNKVYKAEGYKLKIPLEEIIDFKDVRWAELMDL